MAARSEWFGEVTVAGTAFAHSAFEKVERLLAVQQPTAVDRRRSRAAFEDAAAQIELRHLSGRDELRVDLHYGGDLGGMFNPLGYEEYYRLRDDPPVEQEALDDLATVLASTYSVEETWWRGRRIRRVVRQSCGGEERGGSVSGWPLLPPRWLLPREQLTVRRDSVSYGGHPHH